MKPVSEDTTESILAAAKKEFLEYGFVESSLRRISSECGVSTHTIYTRFGSKEGLFDALVKETAEGLYSIYTASVGRAYEGDADAAFTEGDKGSNACLKYVYMHFDEMKLILQCSAGSKYEHYLDKFVETEEKSYLDFLKNIFKTDKQINPFFFHVLSCNTMHIYNEIVEHNMSYEAAEDYLNTYFRFTEAGLKEILGLNKNQD